MNTRLFSLIAVSSALIHCGPSTPIDEPQTWSSPQSVYCSYTDEDHSSYGTSSTVTKTDRCVPGTCDAVQTPDDYEAYGGGATYYDYHEYTHMTDRLGSCAGDAITCDSSTATDDCTKCAMSECCDAYTIVTNDASSQWFLSCVGACQDDTCTQTCVDAVQKNAPSSANAMSSLATCLNKECASKCN